MNRSLGDPYHAVSHPDLVQHPDIMIIELRPRRVAAGADSVFLVNLYNDGVTHAALALLLDLDLRHRSVVLYGDFNLHHPLWSHDDTTQSACSQSLVDWAAGANTFPSSMRLEKPPSSVVARPLSSTLPSLVTPWRPGSRSGPSAVVSTSHLITFQLPGASLTLRITKFLRRSVLSSTTAAWRSGVRPSNGFSLQLPIPLFLRGPVSRNSVPA